MARKVSVGREKVVAEFTLHYFEETDELVVMRDGIEVYRQEVGT